MSPIRRGPRRRRGTPRISAPDVTRASKSRTFSGCDVCTDALAQRATERNSASAKFVAGRYQVPVARHGTGRPAMREGRTCRDARCRRHRRRARRKRGEVDLDRRAFLASTPSGRAMLLTHSDAFRSTTLDHEGVAVAGQWLASRPREGGTCGRPACRPLRWRRDLSNISSNKPEPTGWSWSSAVDGEPDICPGHGLARRQRTVRRALLIRRSQVRILPGALHVVPGQHRFPVRSGRASGMSPAEWWGSRDAFPGDRQVLGSSSAVTAGSVSRAWSLAIEASEK
jgi:hypothetical protein